MARDGSKGRASIHNKIYVAGQSEEKLMKKSLKSKKAQAVKDLSKKHRREKKEKPKQRWQQGLSFYSQ